MDKLPDKWCIKLGLVGSNGFFGSWGDRENHPVVKWFNTNKRKIDGTATYYHSDILNYNRLGYGDRPGEGYTEITLQDFERLILGETTTNNYIIY